MPFLKYIFKATHVNGLKTTIVLKITLIKRWIFNRNEDRN